MTGGEEGNSLSFFLLGVGRQRRSSGIQMLPKLDWQVFPSLDLVGVTTTFGSGPTNPHETYYRHSVRISFVLRRPT